MFDVVASLFVSGGLFVALVGNMMFNDKNELEF